VLGLVPDVYLRDAVGDTGAVPNSRGALSTSPERDCSGRPRFVNPTTAFGEGSGTENDMTLGSQVEKGTGQRHLRAHA